MKVAVAGPTGVLGRALIPQLTAAGHSVRALARAPARARALFPQLAEIVECDLLAAAEAGLAAALAGCEAVVHIATAIPRDFGAAGAWEANTRLRTDGVQRLLAAARAAGLRRYVQQSITMAYPDRGDDWITEAQPLDEAPERALVCGPVIAMERLVRDTPPAALAWCLLRGGAFVGPDTFQAATLERLRAGLESVPGDGGNFVSLIHVADMAAAVVAALERAPAGSTFNITAEPLRSGDYLDRLAASLGLPAPRRDPAAPRPPSWRCSSQAARTRLGWAPRQPLLP